MGDRLKIWYYTELKKLYALNWREKIEYIWNYYKLWIIGIVCFLSLTVFLVVRFATNVEGFWLNGSLPTPPSGQAAAPPSGRTLRPLPNLT